MPAKEFAFANSFVPTGTTGQVAKGMVCAFFIIFVGVLAVIEYLLAFLEFLLVTSVGIILFPLSLWEGSKFLAEKLIGTPSRRYPSRAGRHERVCCANSFASTW